jgi:hypothetical protein
LLKFQLFKGIKNLDLKGRTQSFLELADRLKNLRVEDKQNLFETAKDLNPWFTSENIQLAFDGLINYLDEQKLSNWLEQYDLNISRPKKVGVVMAGNIPMVGIHDFICVLLSGHHLVAKLSSQDTKLIEFVKDKLIEISPEFEKQISFVDKLKDIDAVIATGSDNTARYFKYYFSKIPHIIRKNRTSVAVLNGNESHEELESLGFDIFSYFGLGCRNISKIYVPNSYKFDSLFPHWEKFSNILDHHKYYNNYQYQQSIMLVNKAKHLDNGFLLMQQNANLVSPIGVVYYEFYDNLAGVIIQIERQKDKIQCLVTKEDLPGKIKFGKAQMPDINDFADNIDTMDFLSKL